MAGQFFLDCTKPLVVESLNESLISDHFEALQHTFEGMLCEHNENEMKTFYFLLSRLSNGLSESAKTFEKYLVSQILTPFLKKQYNLKMKEQLTNVDNFCLEFINLKRKYNKLIENCFVKNVLFQESMDKAFATTLNAPNENYIGKQKKESGEKKVRKTKIFKVDRLLAMFVDNLSKGKKELKFSLDEIELLLEDVVKIVAYFTSRDVFFECSKRHLCQRLLSSKRNEDIEYIFLNKLKAQFGQNMVRHLQGMLNDVSGEGKDNIQKEFEDYLEKNKLINNQKIDGISFNVRLLKESHWPVFPEDKIQLQLCSQPMENCRSEFEKFYKKFNAEKRVRWLFNNGDVEIDTLYQPQEKKSSKRKIKKGNIKLIVSPFQSQILCLFNQKKEWTPIEMCQTLFPTSSQMKKEDVLEILFSALSPLVFDPKGPVGIVLTEQDKKILEDLKKKEQEKQKEKTESKKKIKQTEIALEERPLTKYDKFFLKDQIDSTLLRVQYATESSKNFSLKQRKIDVYVKQKREFMLDGAMVRVMKARSVIKWNNLQSEVLKLVQKDWTPSSKEMKERLGSLMEREFIRRNVEDDTILEYIA